MTTRGRVQVMSAAAALRTFTLPELHAYTSVSAERVRIILKSRPDLFVPTSERAGNAAVWRVCDLEKLLDELGDADD